ncbi:MAG TPA: hypothetical protein VI278_10095 [Nitrososphaeraceae archaeon]
MEVKELDCVSEKKKYYGIHSSIATLLQCYEASRGSVIVAHLSFFGLRNATGQSHEIRSSFL